MARNVQVASKDDGQDLAKRMSNNDSVKNGKTETPSRLTDTPVIKLE